jgi:hypothetical protein
MEVALGGTLTGATAVVMANQSQKADLARNRAERLREAAFDLLRMADEIEQSEGNAPRAPNNVSASTRPLTSFPRSRLELLQTASDTYRVRRERERYFPATYFGEPAWDILLDLLANEMSGRPVSVSNACIAASAPATTGMRWLRVLEEDGYIKKVRDQSDSRVTLVILTELARARLTDYLSLLPAPLEPVTAA